MDRYRRSRSRVMQAASRHSRERATRHYRQYPAYLWHYSCHWAGDYLPVSSVRSAECKCSNKCWWYHRSRRRSRPGDINNNSGIKCRSKPQYSESDAPISRKLESRDKVALIPYHRDRRLSSVSCSTKSQHLSILSAVCQIRK